MNDGNWIVRYRPVGVAVTAVFGLLILSAGCREFVVEPDPAERAHPAESFRRIEAFDWRAVSGSPSDPEPNAPDPEPNIPAEITLTIEQCRAAALRHNLDLQVQLYAPLLSAQAVTAAEAVFEPLAFSQFDYVKTDSPTSLELDASQQEYAGVDAGVQLPLRTGGTLSLDFPWSYVETNNAFSTLNPAYTADARVRLEHPLLRGAGVRSNTHSIRIARYESRIAQARTKLEVIRVLSAVDRVYWRLYAAREQLVVRRQQYDLAASQRRQAQRLVNAQKAADIEVIRAEAAVAERQEAIILADNDVRDRERDLKRILNRPDLAIHSATVLIPATPPEPVRYRLDGERLIRYALGHRLELVELELQLAQDASAIDYQRNNSLPLVNLSYTYNINGLGPTSSDAYDLMLDNRFVDHYIGLTVQIPLGNQSARSQWRQAILQRQQRLATRSQRLSQIEQEVLNAADQLEANWQRILASRQSRILAARTLQAEQRHFELGLQTSTELLDAQTKYADALTAEILALTEYQIAQVDLAYATGSLLGAARVEWITAADVELP